MKNTFRNFIRIFVSFILTQKSQNTINDSLFKFRINHRRLFRIIYGTANDEDIFNNILKHLDGKFDILMIHSSFNSMLPMYSGNLNKLLLLLLDYCKKNNVTLVMPTFFLGSSWNVRDYYENGKNIFDVNETGSGMGLMTELFRRKPDVKRSVHPSHSICASGPLADQLTRNHHLANTTFGMGTPFFEMTKHRTIILGIGTNYTVTSQVHTAEDIMKDSYPVNLYSDIIPIKCLDRSGNIVTYNLRVRNRKFVYDEKTIRKILGKISVKWTYKGIPFFSARADVVTETLIAAARNGKTIYKEIKY